MYVCLSRVTSVCVSVTSYQCMCVCHRLLEVRSRLYELLTHCIPPEIIIKVCGYSECGSVCGG